MAAFSPPLQDVWKQEHPCTTTLLRERVALSDNYVSCLADLHTHTILFSIRKLAYMTLQLSAVIEYSSTKLTQ